MNTNTNTKQNNRIGEVVGTLSIAANGELVKLPLSLEEKEFFAAQGDK